MFDYQKEHDFDKRKKESKRIREKYKDKIPTICEISKGSNNSDIILDKKKYLIPADLTIGQFVYTLRKRIKLQPEEALFLFVNGNALAPTAQLLSATYNEHKDEDGFLYFVISKEETFGC